MKKYKANEIIMSIEGYATLLIDIDNKHVLSIVFNSTEDILYQNDKYEELDDCD